MNRQSFPKWLIVWWWVAIISAAPLYLRLLWEQTWLTWTEGPQNVGWTLIHNYGEFFIFGLISFLVVFAWIVSASAYLLIGIIGRSRPAKNAIYYLAIPLVAIALLYLTA